MKSEHLSLAMLVVLMPAVSVLAGTTEYEAVKCFLPTIASSLQGTRDLGTVSLQREERQKSVLYGNIRVHYDTVGSHAATFLDALWRPIPGTSNAFADSVGAIANTVWTQQTSVLGYVAPPGDGSVGGGPEFDIYVLDLGALYGSTIPETLLDPNPQGGRYTTFLEIDNDFVFVEPPGNRGLPALRVTLAHELHHASQIGGYGFWQEHVYFYEMTATWIEDVLYDDVNDYIQYLFSSQSQFSQPDVAFTASTSIMYSRAVWGHFVQKRFGAEVLRSAWELTRQFAVTPLYAMDLALQQPPLESSFRDAFSEWTLWNYFTGKRYDSEYYPEGDLYPVMSGTPEQFNAPQDTIAGLLPPLSSRYYLITSPDFYLAASNLDLNSAHGGSTAQMAFSYLLSSAKLDAGYEETLASIFVKTQVNDVFNWHTWAFVNDFPAELGAPLPEVAEDVPFPNPFFPANHQVINIPIDSEFPLEVELSVFSSDMSLIFSGKLPSSTERGQRVVRWNGTTGSGETAQTGIYFYATSGGGKFGKGKFAVVRR